MNTLDIDSVAPTQLAACQPQQDPNPLAYVLLATLCPVCEPAQPPLQDKRSLHQTAVIERESMACSSEEKKKNSFDGKDSVESPDGRPIVNVDEER